MQNQVTDALPFPGNVEVEVVEEMLPLVMSFIRNEAGSRERLDHWIAWFMELERESPAPRFTELSIRTLVDVTIANIRAMGPDNWYMAPRYQNSKLLDATIREKYTVLHWS